MNEFLGVQAKGLVVKKAGRSILNELTFAVRKGAVTGLIGPSGSGKTTLMRTMVGVQVFSGTLRIFEQSAGSKALRKAIGYVTQAPAIYEDLSVLQNLRYFATLANTPKKDVIEIVKTVHLEEQANQLASTLSGGQKARVSLAIALLGDPELLVLDEPTVGLDPLLRRELWNLFKQLANKGKTLVISSHVMDEAERCDELLLLRDGRILWNGTKKELLQKTRESSVENAFISIVEKGEGE